MNTTAAETTRSPETPEDERRPFDLQFDPTAGGGLQIEIQRPSMGRTPSGFPKLHADLLPLDLMRLIGYDPRAIEAKAKRGRIDPKNINPDIIELHRSVQRSIDQDIVDDMVEYLYRAVSTGRFADWAEIDVVTAAKPDLSRYERDFVAVFPVAADYFVTDGQHRYCAILDFVRKYPQYRGAFTQAAAISVLPTEKLTEWAGQSFHDKNFLRTPVKVTKALVSDTRDLHNRLAKELRAHDFIRKAGGVDEVRDNLPAKAKELATHAVLFKFVRGFVEGRKGLVRGRVEDQVLTDDTYADWKASAWKFLDQLQAAFPTAIQVPGREDYLFRASAALQALGVFGHDLYTRVPDKGTRTAMMTAIAEKKLDWKRTNSKDWSGVIGQVRADGSVSPASSRQAVDGAIKFLKERSGLAHYLSNQAA